MIKLDYEKIRKIALIRARANTPVEDIKTASKEEDLTLGSTEEEYLPKKIDSKE